MFKKKKIKYDRQKVGSNRRFEKSFLEFSLLCQIIQRRSTEK